MALYAEGYSVTNFLVSKSNRPAFLNFIADGMRISIGWDAALQKHYQIRNVEELEQEWHTHLRNTKKQPTQLASATQRESTNQVVVRQTFPPVQPFDPPPRIIARGVAPESEREFPGMSRPNSRPGYLPEYPPSRSSDEWRSQPASQMQPPAVRLGPPQFDAQPPATLGRPIPSGASPVGYPQ
jgi:hypothetical protein